MFQSKQAEIASLVSNTAYRSLLAELVLSFKDIEDALTNAQTAEELTTAARYWQVTRRVLNVLQNTPQIYRAETNRTLGIDIGIPTGEERE